MNENPTWLKWAVELQALAQAGLHYTSSDFERERYARIRDIAAEMLAHQSELPMEKVKDLFCCDTGYQTPSAIGFAGNYAPWDFHPSFGTCQSYHKNAPLIAAGRTGTDKHVTNVGAGDLTLFSRLTQNGSKQL